jgi:ferric-dicitrate binding protein FerR (iron transport regulator)
MSRGPDDQGDDALRRLVRLTRETLAEDAIPGDESELLRLRAQRDAPPARRRRGSGVAIGLGALALAAVAAPFVWRLTRPGPPLTFEIVQGAAEPGAPDGNTRMCFSDGSEIALEDKARAEVRDLRAEGGRILLVRGRARAYVVPRPQARWQIAAGPYLVEVAGEVTGTVFDLAWSDEEQALELWQRKGSARVTGPLIGTGMALTHGQHLSTHVRDNKMLLDSRSPDR